MIKGKYCECGCHGIEYPQVGEFCLWRFWHDTNIDAVTIRIDRPLGGTVFRGTNAECDAYVQAEYNKAIKQEIARLESLLNE